MATIFCKQLQCQNATVDPMYGYVAFQNAHGELIARGDPICKQLEFPNARGHILNPNLHVQPANLRGICQQVNVYSCECALFGVSPHPGNVPHSGLA